MEIPPEYPDDENNLNLNLNLKVVPLHPAQAEPPRRPRTNSPIKPPYPWFTNHRAIVHNLNYLQSNQILTIKGDVKCNQCKKNYKIEYDLLKNFDEISNFIEKNKNILEEKLAPSSWMEPIVPDCKFCGEKNCVKPMIPENEHKSINWLFLLLGQLLGCLKLDHLKYFCGYNFNLRSGPKNRLLFLTYLALCKQLQPSNELFHH